MDADVAPFSRLRCERFSMLSRACTAYALSQVTKSKRKQLSDWTYQEAMDAARADAEPKYLVAILEKAEGDLVRAAAYAGVTRWLFVQLIKKHQISAKSFRPYRSEVVQTALRQLQNDDDRRSR
ncbi:MAG: hypothetical protein ABJE66_31740 [Deltaproteobacteria bacterium]